MAEASSSFDVSTLFTFNERELEEFLDRWRTPSKYFNSLKSYNMMKLCLRERGLRALRDSYPPIWMLLEMKHEDRNNFLLSTRRSVIENENDVRNVGELIEQVRSQWPNITNTVHSLPDVDAPMGILDVTELLLWDHQKLEEIFNRNRWNLVEFMAQNSMWSLFSWLETQRIKYFLRYPLIWRILDMTHDQRAGILQTFKQHSEMDGKYAAASKSLRGFDGYQHALNVEQLKKWVNDLKPLLTEHSGPSGVDGGILTLYYLEGAVDRSILASIFRSPPVHEHKMPELCSIDLLHLTDKESREAILGVSGLSLKDIDNLRSQGELGWLLRHYYEIPENKKCIVEEYQQYWDVFMQRGEIRIIPREWPTYDDLDIRAVTTVGDFLEWMYRHKDFIRRQLERKAMRRGNIPARLQARADIGNMDEIIADVARKHEELKNREGNVVHEQETSTIKTKKSKKKKKQGKDKQALESGDQQSAGQEMQESVDAANKASVSGAQAERKVKSKASVSEVTKGNICTVPKVEIESESNVTGSKVKEDTSPASATGTGAKAGKSQTQRPKAQRDGKDKVTVAAIKSEDKAASQTDTPKGDKGKASVTSQEEDGISDGQLQREIKNCVEELKKCYTTLDYINNRNGKNDDLT